MNVILYKRVSTDEQADKGFSLEFQDDSLRAHCEKNGYNIIGDYIEDASGKNFDRPEFQKLFKWINKNRDQKVQLILFTKWDRYGRNIEEALKYKTLLCDKGVAINAIEQPLDISNMDNLLMLTIYLSLGEQERHNIARRTKDGTVKARRNGYFTGKAPYGYKNIRDSHKKPTLEINEEQARLVRKGFEEVAIGIDSVESIFKKLKSEGLGISKQTFYRMFHNPTYCGRIHVPEWNGEPQTIVEGRHEGLISIETFMKAQIKKTNNRWKGIVPKNEDPEFPLRNYLICSKCGRNLTASNSKGRNRTYGYYHCRKSCKSRIGKDAVHKYFETLLESITIKEEFHDLIHEILEKTIIKYEGDSKKEIARLKSQVRRTSEQLSRLDLQLREERIPLERYNRMATDIEKDLVTYKNTIQELSGKSTPKKESLDKTVWLLSNLSKVYNNADYKGKRRLLATLFPEKIILEKEKCRTTNVNEVVSLIANIIDGLEQKKSDTNGEKPNLYRFVLEAGLEPARPKGHKILSLACLPIPPLEHK